MTLLPLARAFTVAACALAVGALACEARPAAAECGPSSRSLDAPTALVLSGGGAKGAYEAGVAATLVDRVYALRTRVLFAGLLPGWLTLLALDRAGSLFDPAPLRELIDATLDLDRVRVAPVHLLVVTSDLARREARVFDNRTVTRDVLLAAAAVPGAFPAVEVDGTLLVDGGLTGRAPVLEALAAGEPLSRALVVMCYAPGEQGRAPTTMRRALEEAFEMGMIHQIRRDVELARFKYPAVEVQLWTPSAALSLRPLDFDPDGIARALERGRADAAACLRGWATR